MLRGVFISAAVCFGVAVAGLVAVMGGCAADTVKPAARPPTPTAPPVETATPLHPGRVARLEAETTVDAIWFDADAPHGKSGRLRLEPGAWLVPPEAFRSPMPSCCEEKEHNHE